MRTTLSRKRTSSSLSADGQNGKDKSSPKDEESLLPRKPSASDSAPKRYTRVSRAKVFSQKICRIPAGGNNREGRQGIVGLLQDIAGGIVLGTLGMSVLMFLDYSNIINLETARVFRKTAADVFTPEILESLQEEGEAEKKYVSIGDYDAMKKELSDSQAAIDSEKKIVGARTAKEASLKAELAALRPEYDKLMKDLGLDVFCPECHWGMGMNCQQRVNYLLEAYSDSATTIECINKLVKEGRTKNDRCIKSKT